MTLEPERDTADTIDTLPPMNEDLRALVGGIQGIKASLDCDLDSAISVYGLYLAERGTDQNREHLDLDRRAMELEHREDEDGEGDDGLMDQMQEALLQALVAKAAVKAAETAEEARELKEEVV